VDHAKELQLSCNLKDYLHLKEERVDRNGYGAHAVTVKQSTGEEVGIPLIGDATGEVRRIGPVAGGKDPVEGFVVCRKVVIITDVWQIDYLWLNGRCRIDYSLSSPIIECTDQPQFRL
jgi:hypothetical protein